MKVEERTCDPGMKGCILYGRFTFSNPEKNTPSRQRALEENDPSTGKQNE